MLLVCLVFAGCAQITAGHDRQNLGVNRLSMGAGGMTDPALSHSCDTLHPTLTIVRSTKRGPPFSARHCDSRNSGTGFLTLLSYSTRKGAACGKSKCPHDDGYSVGFYICHVVCPWRAVQASHTNLAALISPLWFGIRIGFPRVSCFIDVLICVSAAIMAMSLQRTPESGAGELSGKVALITGPAKGMGASVTLTLAKNGADLVLAGRDTAAIEPVADAARKLSRRVVVVGCDVTCEADMQTAVRAAMDTFGRIDILVHIAGINGPVEKKGWETSSDEFDEVLGVNLKGPFLAMRAVLPVMVAQRYGKIVCMGGTFGMRAAPGRAVYSSSKWGLRGLVKTLAAEAGSHNININCVEPGMVDGDSFENIVLPAVAKSSGTSVDDVRKSYEDGYALHRITSSDDVAQAVAFLVSDRAKQLTGIDLPVDGGWATL